MYIVCRDKDMLSIFISAMFKNTANYFSLYDSAETVPGL